MLCSLEIVELEKAPVLKATFVTEKSGRKKIHGQYTNVCITNEHNTSQICVYCFSRLDHPSYTKQTRKGKVKSKVKGSFLCCNRHCLLVQNKTAIQPRDALSSLAIGLSGLCNLVFGCTFPCFSLKLSQCNTNFQNLTSSFLNERTRMGSDFFRYSNT